MDRAAIREIVKSIIHAHCDLARPFSFALQAGEVDLQLRPSAQLVEQHLRKALGSVLGAESAATFPDYIDRAAFDFEQRVERLRHIAKRQLDRAEIRGLETEEMVGAIVDAVLAETLGQELPARMPMTLPRRARRR